MFKKLEVLLACALLTAVGLGGCTEVDSQQDQTAQVDLYEVGPSILNAPLYVALEQSLFFEEGLAVKLTTVQSSEEVTAALQEGQADIGLAGAETSIEVYQASREDYLVNFSQLTQREGSFLLGRKPEDDFQWENLRGKRIIIAGHKGKQGMVLEYILNQHGLNPNQDVEIILETNAADIFIAGTGDYVVVGEPEVSWLENSDLGCIAASIGIACGDIPDTVYMAKKSTLEEKPELIQKFSNALYQGQLWVDSHSPGETAGVITPFFPEIDLGDLTLAVERYQQQNSWCVTTVMDETSFYFMQKIIRNAGQLEQLIPANVLINTDFAKKSVLHNES